MPDEFLRPTMCGNGGSPINPAFTSSGNSTLLLMWFHYARMGFEYTSKAWRKRLSGHTDRSRFHFLIAVAVGLTLTAAFAIGLSIWWLRSDAIREAQRDADHLSVVLAEQTIHSVQAIDLMLSELQERIEALGARTPDDFRRLLQGETTHQLLMERLARLSHVASVTLIDKDGWIVNSTSMWPLRPTDLSDREHFQYLKNNDDRGIYISSPLPDRVRGIQTIFFVKRISGAANELVGMITIGVRLSYFQHIYGSITSLGDLSFLFLRKDGTVIVRYPDSNDRAGETMPAGSPWYQLVAQGGGHYRSPGYFDGIARLIAVRPLRDYPLVVNVAVSETAALAHWRMQAIILSVGALLVMFSLVVLLRALSRQFHRLATSEVELIKQANDLKLANAKVDVALDNMSQGLAMFNRERKLVVCNKRYAAVYNLPSELTQPGTTQRDILEYRIANGIFAGIDPRQYLDDRMAIASEGKRRSSILELSNGRSLFVCHQPLEDGGWVSTHEDITERRRTEAKIAHMAHYDGLTDLPNRKLFCERLEQNLKCVGRGQQLAVLFLDVDHLKRVNDTLGHPVGDKLLKAVADRLRGCVKDGDVVARLSGDEFAIIQASLDGISDAAALAGSVREAILEPFDLGGHQVRVDISAGISIAPDHATEVNELLKTADIALYEAKNSGRGTYRFYERDMNARVQARGKLERDLRHALNNGEFELFYQPVVGLEDNTIHTFEALLRWRHPERGIVSPAEFIPIAEEMGLIVPLGEWVLRTACAEAANWPDDIQVAINVSPIQLTNKNLVNAVVGIIASTGIRPNRLELELTESVFIQNTPANLATLKGLHELGVQFVMDDFGTGYSSLGYLMDFPFHKIKIDRSFIAGLQEKIESRAIVRAIADLARSLGMQVTAEGVETAQQLEQVQILGCTEIQGYLIGAPRPAGEVRALFLPHAKEAACMSEVA